ncbi:hypothetical protein SS50377_21181 [Spironucleus salmonicida]|uniref:Uncharacterized protein n=1 Tax=Spironucleus salmonicida TaxID=348837 RepID=V6LI11_9EUKA|nr:hypothetical protein SS50377_21181 [Spironucleus salmonicida]|eukprot:EST43958.1 Hypothetical protein SS50377_16264 [Spironucleus salmonicida]
MQNKLAILTFYNDFEKILSNQCICIIHFSKQSNFKDLAAFCFNLREFWPTLSINLLPESDNFEQLIIAAEDNNFREICEYNIIIPGTIPFKRSAQAFLQLFDNSKKEVLSAVIDSTLVDREIPKQRDKDVQFLDFCHESERI